MSEYIPLEMLEVYKLARDLSKMAWKIYEKCKWQDKKIIADQFIRATDSIGANIAEGYSRYHYLDRVRFYYQSRGSLSESYNHWLELMLERKIITNEEYVSFKSVAHKLSLKLNNFIKSSYKSKNSKPK